ncbi:MAG: hypothetical protein ABEI75_01175 [Halobaculum sp.]
MEETPRGTPVGVDDPYDHAGTCDHLTDDGRCRYALNHAGRDPQFAQERARAEYACVAAGDCEFADCPHYRSTTDGRECARCGLEEVRMAHDDSRPLLEEHHLSYGGSGSGDGRADTSSAPTDASGGPTGQSDDPFEPSSVPTHSSDRPTHSSDEPTDTTPDAEPSHEITVVLCRWCHAKIHEGWARITDDAAPDAEAIAEREARRSAELEEAGFQTAAERRDE